MSGYSIQKMLMVTEAEKMRLFCNPADGD